MLEDNGLDPACPYLNVAGWYFNWLGITFPDNHIHGTSGCVASRLSSRRGAAQDVSLFSANAFSYSDSNVTAAADWIISRNIDVTNMSFGGNYRTERTRSPKSSIRVSCPHIVRGMLPGPRSPPLSDSLFR
jgi:hypothetical protein